MRSCGRSERGFTLIELMIVMVIIGILATIAIPNYSQMRDRAWEGSTKANMHTFQLAAEDYNIQNDASYAADAADVASLIPAANQNFKNPFDRTSGDGNSWRDVATFASPLSTGSTKAGIVAYSDNATRSYEIAGRGRNGDFSLVLSGGQ